ncbi:DUF3791 domain-containing protein [Victivallaceae bacterium BBE-744-WT-12]|uniref:DUF3791 domain-containing protein n=2 Tax=Victivallis TaxID=172900 RepID=A0A848AXG5_9BACT|nr:MULTISPECIES: DUF3791 domain-containing protein [Victivallis]MST97159.1 DUF3791 domain-containing protein [Victivallis lenta]NMD88195.1 DUF3791 domain-containing protein [Victivallis vadensis]
MEANSVLLQKKYARIVVLFAEQMQLTLDEALEFFYRSETYQELRDGIADLHCRSDQYIVDELKLEFQSAK